MDVREKLVEQAISYFWYGVSHDIFSEPVTTYAKLAIEALKKENGVTVQECKLGVKKTNADRIRSMSDEELVEFIDDIAAYVATGKYCTGFLHVSGFPYTCFDTKKCCEKHVVEWLRQPAEEADNETIGERKDGYGNG